jgi:hypothetical protein
VTQKVLEGKSANLRRQEELLSDIQSKCKTIRRTSISPIFLGVRQAIADLRAHECEENSLCKVFVDSDLEENVESSIKEGLDKRHSTRHFSTEPLDNQGIGVTFCGVAVTTPRTMNSSGEETRRTLTRDSDREENLRMVWRSLFTQPELVKFEPYCSTLRDRVAHLTPPKSR